MYDGKLDDVDNFENKTHIKPYVHGIGMTINLNEDIYGIVDDKLDLTSGQKTCLADDFVAPWLLNDSEHCVLVTESNWRAGKETAQSYKPLTKYTFTVRTDETTDNPSRPQRSLSFEVIPQYDSMVYPDGNECNVVYETGTKLKIRTTHVTKLSNATRRVANLLDDLLDIQLTQNQVIRESVRFFKLEVSLRHDVEKLVNVVESIANSKRLLQPDNYGKSWINSVIKSPNKARLDSEKFDYLGFPSLPCRGVSLKTYQRRNPQKYDYPLNQPRIEAFISKDSNQPNIPYSEFHNTVRGLRAILLSHLEWAGVTVDDIVRDPLQEALEEYTWKHPADRRKKLHESLQDEIPEIVKKVVHRSRTDTVFDLLKCLLFTELSYDELADKLGCSKATVRYHVSTLVEQGILSKYRAWVTFVHYPSDEVRDAVYQALYEIRPDDIPADRELRATNR